MKYLHYFRFNKKWYIHFSDDAKPKNISNRFLYSSGSVLSEDIYGKMIPELTAKSESDVKKYFLRYFPKSIYIKDKIYHEGPSKIRHTNPNYEYKKTKEELKYGISNLAHR